MSYSVIIPSKIASNLVPCVRALLACEPLLAPDRVIVVDDGSRAQATPFLPQVLWVDGVKPFVYARNCNLGIEAAGRDDVILMNDDALLQTPLGFTELSKVSEGWGVVSSSTNNVGNRRQSPQGASCVRDEKRMVCFICVYIPRTTIDNVGLLDEEFVGYGFEDDSYCLRARRSGLKIGIFDGCFVDHGTLQSTFRAPGYPTPPFSQNRDIFRAKYGADHGDL